MQRKKKAEKIVLLVFLCFFSAMLLLFGFSQWRESTEEYKLPIYISKSFTVSADGSLSCAVDGELTNRTDETVVINSLTIHLSGSFDGKKYAATVTDWHIEVPANSTYQFHSGGHSFQDKAGSFVPSSALQSAKVKDCEIDGKSVELWSMKDGKLVSSAHSSWYVPLIFGCITLAGAVVDVVFLVKAKRKDAQLQDAPAED